MMLQLASLGSNQDVIRTPSSTVSCDGLGHKSHGKNYGKDHEEGHSGHPLVYLAMGKEGRVTCPYCSRQFILVEQPDY